MSTQGPPDPFRPVTIDAQEILRWKRAVLDLCCEIEKMGCSKELTDLSIMASNLHSAIQAVTHTNCECNEPFASMPKEAWTAPLRYPCSPPLGDSPPLEEGRS
jgi:hypothetical protein